MNARFASALAASALALLVARGFTAPAQSAAASAQAVSLSSAATGGASPAALVPAGFDFLLDVNLRTFLDTPEVQPLRSRILPPGYKQIVDQVYIAVGVDLLRDIDRAVIAGRFGAENKGDVAIILAGRWKADGVIDVLASSPQYDSFAVGGKTVHQFWSQKDADLRFVSFLGPGLAVIGKLKSVEGVIAAYEHRGDTLLGDPSLAALAGPGAPGFVRVLARGSKASAGGSGEAPFLPNLRGASLQIGAGDGLEFQLTAALADPHAAKLALQAVQGLQAFVQLQGRQPELADAASRIQCSLSGELGIQAGAKIPMQDALRLFAAVRHNRTVPSL